MAGKKNSGSQIVLLEIFGRRKEKREKYNKIILPKLKKGKKTYKSRIEGRMMMIN